MGLDDVGSGLSEVDELAQELGMPPGGPLSDAANALEQAFGDPLANPPVPLPPESFRFLIGPPTPGTTPTDGDDPEDHVAHAGRLLDQLGLVGGYGKMAAGILNEQVIGQVLFSDKKFDRPGWLVLAFRCTEALSRLWRAEVTLIRPEMTLQDITIQTAIDAFLNSLTPDQIQAANAGPNPWAPGFGAGGPTPPPMLAAIMGDANEAITGGRTLWNQLQNPAQYAPFSDWENPDALDPRKVPDRANGIPPLDSSYVVGKLAVDPADWLGQFARISVARRAPDRFTLGERWWSGICTEIEDEPDLMPNVRRIRIVMQPRLCKLSLRKQNRIFQDMTAIQIVKLLLKEHGIYDGDDVTPGVNGRLKLVPPPLSLGPLAIPGEVAGVADGLGEMLGGLPVVGSSLDGVADTASDLLRESEDNWTQKREICVQYDETDLELFERLLAEEGITFFFKGAERDEILVLADDPIYGGKKSLMIDRRPMQVAPGVGLPINANSRELAWDVRSERALVPSTVTMRDYNHSRPNYVTEVAAGKLLPSLAGGTSVASTLGQIASSASDVLLAGTPAGGLLPGGADALVEADYAGAEAAWFEYPAPLNLLRKDDAGYLDPAAEYDTYDGEPLAEMVLDRFRAEGARVVGTSTVLSLMAGNHVSMQGGGFDILAKNPRQPVKLLVTEMQHFGSNAAPAAVNPNDPTSAQYVAAGLAGNQLQYSNTFRAQNVMIRYRPPRPTRRPAIHGVQTATVLDVNWIDDPSAAAHEAHVDKLWRALVRFHWDRRPFSFVPGDPVEPPPLDPTKLAHACWVRVASGFAGSGFGTVFAPRVGMEVLVAFRDGNPDRPVIVGCMNNGVAGDHTYAPGRDRSGKEENTQPRYVSDAARKTESIIRTRSLPRAEKERANELMLVDNGGIEKIWVFAQRDLKERVRHDHVTTVQHDQSNRVGGNQTEKVGKDQTLFVNRQPESEEDFCRIKTVSGNETVVLGSGGMTKDGRGHEIVGKDSITVDGNRDEKIGTFETVTVDGKTEDGGRAEIARLLSVSGSQEVLVTETDLLNVSGDRTITAKGALTVKAAQITMSTPGAATPGTGDPEADPENGITMDAGGVEAHGKGRLQVYGGQDVTVSSDADKVLVRAQTSIVIRVRNHSIELDAADGAIRILADPDSELRVGTPTAFVLLTNAEAKIEVGDNQIVSTADSEAKATLKGAKVELDFEGEIHMNAPSVEYQRST